MMYDGDKLTGIVGIYVDDCCVLVRYFGQEQEGIYGNRQVGEWCMTETSSPPEISSASSFAKFGTI